MRAPTPTTPSSKAAASPSSAATSRPRSHNRWAGTLVGLQKGTLVYQARAIDRVANHSPLLTQKAKLTKR